MTSRRSRSRLPTTAAALEGRRIHVGGVKVTDNSAKVANLDADGGQLQDLLNIQAAQKRVAELTEKDGAAKQADEDRKCSAASARSGAQAAKQAQEFQKQQWDERIRIVKDGGQLSATAEASAWDNLAGEGFILPLFSCGFGLYPSLASILAAHRSGTLAVPGDGVHTRAIRKDACTTQASLDHIEVLSPDYYDLFNGLLRVDRANRKV